MPDFIVRRERGETLQCDSCNMPVPTAEFDWGPPFSVVREHPKRLLCDFCCSTMASRHTEYPARDEYSVMRAEIWKAAAGVFHMIKGDVDG